MILITSQRANNPVIRAHGEGVMHCEVGDYSPLFGLERVNDINWSKPSPTNGESTFVALSLWVAWKFQKLFGVLFPCVNHIHDWDEDNSNEATYCWKLHYIVCDINVPTFENGRHCGNMWFNNWSCGRSQKGIRSTLTEGWRVQTSSCSFLYDKNFDLRRVYWQDVLT